MGHFPFARANFTFAPCLRALLRVGGVSPKVLAYWKSMQSRSVIEAITWLGFPMCWHPGTRRIFVE